MFLQRAFLAALISLSTFLVQSQIAPALKQEFDRAVSLQAQGKFEEAAAAYKIVIDKNPNYFDALANYGVVLSRLNRFEEASRSYERALALRPGLPELLYNIAVSYYRQGNFVKAADSFKDVLEKRPDIIQARQFYGLSLLETGRDEEATVQLELTLADKPHEVAVLYSLGLAYLHLNRSSVRDMIDQLSAIDVGVPLAHLLRGQMLIAQREFEKAVVELQSAQKLRSNLPKLNYSLGLAYQQLGQASEARVAFEKELETRPNDFPTLYFAALVSETAGDVEAAEKYLVRATKLAPESPDVLALKGRILFKKGKAAEAVEPLEKSVAAKPDDPDRRLVLARVYQQLGRKDDASREFAEVQKLKAKQLRDDREKLAKP